MTELSIIQRIYNATIRDRLPKKHRVLAGVAVPDAPLLDQTADELEYKKGLIGAIADTVEEDDHVAIVGFGRGVSTIHSLDAGAEYVVAYEAAEEMINLGQETLRINRPLEKQVRVKHSIVGDPIKLYGTADDAMVVPPEDFSPLDTLILDCEGSERSILEGLQVYPEKIICETHPERGVQTGTIIDIIENEYSIDLREYRPDDDLGKKVVVAHLTIQSKSERSK